MATKKIKVLIISGTPWDIGNSFGRTFSNLFGGMKDVELYNICCKSGPSNNHEVVQQLQMCETMLVRGFLGRKHVATGETSASVIKKDNGQPNLEARLFKYGQKHRRTIYLLARDVLWKICSTQYKRAISAFIDDVKPDILYVPIFKSLYMCDVAAFTCDYARVPVVGHITDDVYGYYPFKFRNTLTNLCQILLRKKVRRLVKQMAYIEVFAENMKEKYEELFNKKCFVIGRSVDLQNIRKPQKPRHVPRHMVYTGGIGGSGRFGVLMAVGRALLQPIAGGAVLDLYTSTPLSKAMKDEIDSIKSIVFHGEVSGSEVAKIQQDADFLLHVEGFSREAIQATWMSFSTKIIDYLVTGNVVVAIGPPSINSIQVIKNHGIGIVIDNANDIEDTIIRLLHDDLDYSELQMNAYQYLMNSRNRETIQDGMLKRLKALVNKN